MNLPEKQLFLINFVENGETFGENFDFGKKRLAFLGPFVKNDTIVLNSKSSVDETDMAVRLGV